MAAPERRAGMYDKMEEFKQMLDGNDELRQRMNEAAAAFNGDISDNRAVFEGIIVPVSKEAGIVLDYDKVLAETKNDALLTDEELEAVAGGAGAIYQKVVCGALAAMMVFSTVPTAAIAKGGATQRRPAATQTIAGKDGAKKDEADKSEQATSGEDSANKKRTDKKAAAKKDGKSKKGAKADKNGSAKAKASGKAQSKPPKSVAQKDVSAAQASDGTNERINTAKAEKILSKYSAGFSNDDIALPKGLEADDEGIKLTSAAPASVVQAAQDSGEADGVKEVDYSAGKLAYVNDDSEKVMAYGKNFYGLIKSCVSADFEGIFSSGADFLKLIGVLEKDADDPSNADLMKEMGDLKNLVESMSNRLDDTSRQTYQNRLTVFDNAVGALGIECEVVEQMYAKAYRLAEERGLLNQDNKEALEAPGELELPAKPEGPKLPAEPAEPTLPAKPELSSSAESQRSSQSDEGVSLVGGECDSLAAEHERAIAEWQAECDRLTTEYADAVAAWKAECRRLKAEYNKAVANWKSECKRLKAEHKKAEADYKKAKEDYENAKESAGKDIDTILVKLMRDEDAKGNRDFRDYAQYASDIRHNFETVAVECAKKEGASPFTAFDSYWNLYFNWETQGYYLRQAYRTRAQYTLKRAYALLGLHYGFAANPNDPTAAKPLTKALRDALNGIDALPAGTDPATVNADGEYAVKCLINGRTAKRGGAHFFAEGNMLSEDQAKQYVSRLHGKNVKEDLQLAGLYSPKMDADFVQCPDGKSWWRVAGIGIRAERSDATTKLQRFFGADNYHHFWTRILNWDGSLQTVKTGDDEGKCLGFNPAYHCLSSLTYWWFDFA